MLQIWALDNIGEITHGADIADVVISALDTPLQDGDIVVVTSKIVSKAEGRSLRADDREEAIIGETVRVGVIVSDTLGRAWREGQTDQAIGAAGIYVFEDLRGSVDAEGRPLVVTMPCVADELASATDLVKGKTSRKPVAIVRGRGDLVGSLDLPGARSIVRPLERDMFHTGSAEAYAEGFDAGLKASQSDADA